MKNCVVLFNQRHAGKSVSEHFLALVRPWCGHYVDFPLNRNWSQYVKLHIWSKTSKADNQFASRCQLNKALTKPKSQNWFVKGHNWLFGDKSTAWGPFNYLGTNRLAEFLSSLWSSIKWFVPKLHPGAYLIFAISSHNRFVLCPWSGGTKIW